MNEALNYVFSIVNSCIEGVLLEKFKKFKNKNAKIQFDKKVIDDIESNIKDEFEKEKLLDWLARNQYTFNQNILFYNESDKEKFIKEFFDKNKELSHLHGKETTRIIHKYIEHVNEIVDKFLSPEGKLLINAVEHNSDNIIKQMQSNTDDLKMQLDNIQTSIDEVKTNTRKSTNKKCLGYGNRTGLCDNVIEDKESKYCNKCLKAEYQDKIMNLYKIQKYEIVKGDTFFVAKQNLGIVSIKIVVFPFYSNTLDASDSEIFTLINTKNQIANINDYQFIHAISNSIIQPSQDKLLKSNNIEFYTEETIISQIMDFEYYLKNNIKEYEKKELFTHYIDLYDEFNDDLLEYSIDDFINSPENNGLFILGDYGCGKTSFLLNIAYKFSKDYFENKNTYIPLFIPLKDYSKSINFDSLFMNFFMNKCNIPNPSIEAFRLLLKYQKFIILFDGFDEVAKRVNYDIKSEIFNEICKFGIHNTKLVVSCRPNYFQEKKEYKTLMETTHLHLEPNINSIDFDEIYIKELDEYQISEYIETFKNDLKSTHLKAEEIKMFMKETHDLMDLAKRPFLLNIIVKTLPQIINDLRQKKDISDFKINAASLYDKYVNIWLDRENMKGKTLIRKEDKLHFCKYIAYKMFIDDNYFLHFSQFPEEIRKYFKNLSNFDEIDYFSHDIQSCSFMATDGLGNFKFIHKSFIEYFVAITIADKFKKIDNINTDLLNETLSLRGVSTEIALFINDILDDNLFIKEKVLSALEYNLENVDGIVRENIITILSKTKHNVANIIEDGKNYVKADFSHAVIKNKTIRNANFSNASFYNCHIENVKFVNCNFEQSYFQKATLKHVIFSKQNLEYADFSYCTITNCKFMYSILADSHMSQSKIIQNDFEGCDLSGINVKDSFFEKNYYEDSIGKPYEMD